MKLRNKLNILVIGLTILSIAIPSIISYTLSKEMLKNQVDNYQKAELEKYTYDISGWISTQSQIVITISDIIKNAYTKDEITDDLLQSYLSYESISDIYIGFTDGQFISGQGWIPEEGYNPRVRPWYKETMGANRLIISNIYFDLTTKQNAVSIGIPLKDKNGDLIGVLGADILLNSIIKKIDNILLNDLGYAFLLNTDGTILVHNDESLINQNVKDLHIDSFYYDLLNQQNGTGEYTFRGKSKIAVFNRIENTQWLLVLVLDKDKVYQPLTNLLVVFIFIIIGAIFLAAALTSIFNRSISKRLKILSEASISFSKGEFDTEIADLGKDEIGEVSRAFDRMKLEIKDTITELQWIAHIDLLTKLPNRLKLMEDINTKISEDERKEQEFSILFIDLDDFKNINDTLGYDIGDLLLQTIANLLKENYSTYRIGADEFVIILHNFKSHNELYQIVDHISQILNCNINLKDNIVYNSATIGVTIYPRDFISVHDMMIRTDAALNLAKKKKRSSIQYYEYNISKDLENRMMLEKGLRKALTDHELFLHYQPIVDKSFKIKGFEALIRWKNKEGKIISPGEFIPVAENMTIIHDMGLWIIREALVTLNTLQQKYQQEFTMAINISANQIKLPGFDEKVIQIIKEVEVEPKFIEFEITETVLIESMELAKRQLQSLSDYGIRISLDDFGTGYSSLNYLQHFPIHIVKIDKSFIDYLQRNTASRSLVKQIISIAHWLDMEIVAEGVENTFQKEYLSENDCDNFQGYLFYKPMPTQDIYNYLDDMFL